MSRGMTREEQIQCVATALAEARWLLPLSHPAIGEDQRRQDRAHAALILANFKEQQRIARARARDRGEQINTTRKGST